MNRTQIREIFLRNGFNIKPGCDDLKSYVYAAAEELLNLAEAERLSTEQGEPVAYLRRDQLQQIKTRGPVVGCISPSPRVDMVAVYTAPQPAERNPSAGDSLTPVPDEMFAAEFAAWWEEHGRFCRAGGGTYERTFAFEAWRHLYPKLMKLQKVAAEQGEPVAEVVWSDVEGRRGGFRQYGQYSSSRLPAGTKLYTHPQPAEQQPVSWIRIRGDHVILSRCDWMYPESTEDSAGPQDEQRFTAVGRRDGDIVLPAPEGAVDREDLKTMLDWSTALKPAEQSVSHDWDDQDKCRRCGDRNWWTSDTCTPKQQPAPDVEKLPREAIAELIKGMAVSVDVSTGESDFGNRYFGVVDEVQWSANERHGMMLLVQEPEANFATSASPDVSALVELLAEARDHVVSSTQPVRGGFIDEIDTALAAHRKGGTDNE